jgi:hypothetical protein
VTEAFYATGALAAFGAIAHGYLGERLVLAPLGRQVSLPATRLGGERSTMRMIRFSWHFFTVVMAGLAVAFLLLATGAIGGGDWALVRLLAVSFAIFGVLVLVLSRGRHFAWILGFACAGTACLGTL